MGTKLETVDTDKQNLNQLNPCSLLYLSFGPSTRYAWYACKL
jgi:hypothetical protein